MPMPIYLVNVSGDNDTYFGVEKGTIDDWLHANLVTGEAQQEYDRRQEKCLTELMTLLIPGDMPAPSDPEFVFGWGDYYLTGKFCI